MNSYFSTFPAGCQEIILKQLKVFRPAELQILRHDDSSVMFNSPLPFEKFIEVRFFTNTYLLIENPVPKGVLRGKFFRLMLLKQGAPTEMDVHERQLTENHIRSEFGLIPHTGQSLNDFYVIERADGPRLLGLRLARAKFKRDEVAAGELRPELANILCLVAGLKAKHILLDPFAGHGAIPYEAVRGFGCKQVVAADELEIKKRHQHAAIEWHKADVGNLKFIKDRSVDRLITDPPWGIYDAKGSAELVDLYERFLREAARVLKPSGVAVVLSGSDLLTEMLKASTTFRILAEHHILVSGKKATIFKLQRL